jgi:hypothetical protein
MTLDDVHHVQLAHRQPVAVDEDAYKVVTLCGNRGSGLMTSTHVVDDQIASPDAGLQRFGQGFSRGNNEKARLHRFRIPQPVAHTISDSVESVFYFSSNLGRPL